MAEFLVFCLFSREKYCHQFRNVYLIRQVAINRSINHMGRPKRAEQLDVNINTGAQSIERANVNSGKVEGVDVCQNVEVNCTLMAKLWLVFMAGIFSRFWNSAT